MFNPFNRPNRRISVKKRTNLILGEYEKITEVALNPAINYNEKLLRIQQHYFNIEILETQLFYTKH